MSRQQANRFEYQCDICPLVEYQFSHPLVIISRFAPVCDSNAECWNPLSAVAKIVDKLEVAALDPRGVFVLCSTERVFVWVGVECTTRAEAWTQVGVHGRICVLCDE